MYYFYDKQDKVEKYRVSYDKELIEELRKEIIYNCSLIEQCEVDSSYNPNIECYHTIGNSSYKYIYPQLVLYIDEFLKGNIQIIGTAPETTDVVDFLKGQIDSLSKEIDSIGDLEIEQKQIELKKLKKQQKLNENQKSTSEYFEKFNYLVGIELVDTLLKEEPADTDRINSFYGRETKYTRKLSQKRELV